MRKPLMIAIAIIAAAVCAQPLMLALQHLVLPPEQRLIALSPAEPFAALAMFALFLCACAGLATAVGCYFGRYSRAARWTIVLLPMLAAAAFITLLKATQFRYAQSVTGIIGVPPEFSLRLVSLYMIPAAGFSAGVLAVTVSTFLRARNGN